MTLLSCPVALFFLVLNCVSVTERSGYYGVGGGGVIDDTSELSCGPFFPCFCFVFFLVEKQDFWGRKNPNHVQQSQQE